MWYENTDFLITIIAVVSILGYTIRACVDSYFKNKHNK
jgi:hypothetical protein